MFVIALLNTTGEFYRETVKRVAAPKERRRSINKIIPVKFYLVIAASSRAKQWWPWSLI